ncbi:hypothetical protein DFH09DRAFT_1375523 [Mycena vulgaris]|nr:hypothetical protein DFH09DRAFT_1375523 [Mycena vulgaris]
MLGSRCKYSFAGLSPELARFTAPCKADPRLRPTNPVRLRRARRGSRQCALFRAVPPPSPPFALRPCIQPIPTRCALAVPSIQSREPRRWREELHPLIRSTSTWKPLPAPRAPLLSSTCTILCVRRRGMNARRVFAGALRSQGSFEYFAHQLPTPAVRPPPPPGKRSTAMPHMQQRYLPPPAPAHASTCLVQKADCAPRRPRLLRAKDDRITCGNTERQQRIGTCASSPPSCSSSRVAMHRRSRTPITRIPAASARPRRRSAHPQEHRRGRFSAAGVRTTLRRRKHAPSPHPAPLLPGYAHSATGSTTYAARPRPPALRLAARVQSPRAHALQKRPAPTSPPSASNAPPQTKAAAALNGRRWRGRVMAAGRVDVDVEEDEMSLMRERERSKAWKRRRARWEWEWEVGWMRGRTAVAMVHGDELRGVGGGVERERAFLGAGAGRGAFQNADPVDGGWSVAIPPGYAGSGRGVGSCTDVSVSPPAEPALLHSSRLRARAPVPALDLAPAALERASPVQRVRKRGVLDVLLSVLHVFRVCAYARVCCDAKACPCVSCVRTDASS